jgi:GT2 family glycosyltransferase
MSDRVYILLPVHNRRAVTEGLIRCFSEQTYRNFHLVLIDDGSQDGTAGMVLSYLPGTTVITGCGTWWWAGSLQRGFRWLRRNGADPLDLVLIINDDTRVEPEFLERAIEALRDRPRTLLLAQLYDQNTGGFLECGARADWSTLAFVAAATPAEVNCFSTRGLFMRVSDMFEIGGFHPVLLPHYASDYEYTLRAVRKGFTLMSASQVRLWFTQETTGVRRIERRGFFQFIRTAMSKRATGNPFYWTTFILLACPTRYVPRNLYRVWRSFFQQALGR